MLPATTKPAPDVSLTQSETDSLKGGLMIGVRVMYVNSKMYGNLRGQDATLANLRQIFADFEDVDSLTKAQILKWGGIEAASRHVMAKKTMFRASASSDDALPAGVLALLP